MENGFLKLAAPRMWNELPVDIRCAQKLMSFKRKIGIPLTEELFNNLKQA